jgi:AraC-like DNA-binding protein
MTHQPRPLEIFARFKEEVERDFAHLLSGELDDLGEIHHYAERLHIHPTHLSNTIQELTGFSPCDFINNLYLTEAERRLAQTNATIAEVSYALGFTDPSNFTKYFRKHRGVSPRDFRKALLAA